MPPEEIQRRKGKTEIKVLVACEYSGTVRDAFTARGHDATSCDLLPSEAPGKHYQGDIRDILKRDWDLLIAHPPCTFLTITGNRWFRPEFKERYPNREQDRIDAINFFMTFTYTDIPKVCIENPVGIMSTVWKRPEQYIQPYHYGHDAAKKTCLWLKNLPLLIPTKVVDCTYRTYHDGRRMSEWYASISGSKDRAKIRSKTFQGIAEAMAEQWG